MGFTTWMLLVTSSAALRVPTTSSRRTAIAAAATLSFARPAAPTHAMSEMGFLLRRDRKEQQACFDRLECENEDPYYTIQCDRDDAHCLDRKRRLASKALQQGFGGPSSGALTVFALFAFLGPTAKVVRAAAKLFKRGES